MTLEKKERKLETVDGPMAEPTPLKHKRKEPLQRLTPVRSRVGGLLHRCR